MQKQRVTLEQGIDVDYFQCDAIIVGSGAAGLNCAERLYNAGIRDIAILTSNLFGGTSYQSGSDKQTYYKISVFGDASDSPIEMAHSLFDSGAMHGDLAYIESIYSLPAFYNLIENGVPFPHNRYGAYVGYKTDHDPRQRATSAGPRTSRFMVERALSNVKQKGIPIFDKTTVVRISVSDKDKKQVCGVVAVNRDQADEANLGITIFAAGTVILATGGPGELYKASVYPKGQVSLHGAALEAGASLVNLGESQFGITSTRFRWNMSGSYQQAIPSYFSCGKDGIHRNFLEDYFRNASEMSSNIFLKGYQWPFSALNATNFGSSLIDIAVDSEIRSGRKVFLNYTANPIYKGEQFNLSILNKESREYLEKSKALQSTPYERLKQLNPDSIGIFTEQNISLRDPLEIAVSFQHNNGGIDVDEYFQSDIRYLFAIGEIAGTHGISRPGGAALNSGQVGGIRVAQYLKAKRVPSLENSDRETLIRDARFVFLESGKMLENNSQNHWSVRSEVQERMTRSAGFIRDPSNVHSALLSAKLLAQECLSKGLRASNKPDITHAWETRNLVISHLAFLQYIDYYIQDNGGSRGSYLILNDIGDSPSGADIGLIMGSNGVLFEFRKEQMKHRVKRIKISGIDMNISAENIRPIPDDISWFETVWADFREGNIYLGE